MSGAAIIGVSLLYMGVLFGIAWLGDRRADAARRAGLPSPLNNPTIYALSLAVYCTAWTFYGSVGRAATAGAGYLPIYFGPTLMAILWMSVLRKMIRISKANRITTIADFIGSRYGKSSLLSGLVTFIAVAGIVPYISLQLKAVATTFDVLWREAMGQALQFESVDMLRDSALPVALLLALFAIVFGTRSLDATEHHEGVVLSIAFESIVKLVSFSAVGIFVTYGLYNGYGDLFSQAAAVSDLRDLFVFNEATGSFADWAWLMFLSSLAILFLPRQFQMAVVENVDEKHVKQALWLLPLYLFLINLFVLPIAFAGTLRLPNTDADFFVLTLPLSVGQNGLALLAFVGGLSAATGMVIVSTIALSTMVSNDLMLPVLLRWQASQPQKREDLTGLLLAIRRFAIVAIVLASYVYFRLAGDSSLVSIGLISFAAVAQFAPAILGGLYWKRGTHHGALVGLIVGFALWGYTLPLPTLFGEVGASSFIDAGLLGISWLRPYALLGAEGMNPLTHSLMWSLMLNGGCYLVVSLLTSQSILERTQATRFVDVYDGSAELDRLNVWSGSVTVAEIERLLRRFLGKQRVDDALVQWQTNGNEQGNAELVAQAEKLLAGAIGTASAHVMISSIVARDPLTLDAVMEMLDETSQAIRYSKRLERQSAELEATTAALRTANERLRELDDLKNEFVSHVTHELRTPLTSIRAFSEILYDNSDLELTQRQEFLTIITTESERLTRLVNNVLDLSKIESGQTKWLLSDVDLIDVIHESVASLRQLFHERGIVPELQLPVSVPAIECDRDRIVQVILNLLSNAIKFCDREFGRIQIHLVQEAGQLRVSVSDNGEGIAPEDVSTVFERFQQVRAPQQGNPTGTGLGLPISYRIIQHFNGNLWVDTTIDEGATFHFTLPLPPHEAEPYVEASTHR
ncbi:MAG: sodium:solute symporter family transporter [Candidatus Promineifilaceae bacterium]